MCRFFGLGFALFCALILCAWAEENALIPELAQYKDAEMNLSPITIERLDATPDWDRLNCVALSKRASRRRREAALENSGIEFSADYRFVNVIILENNRGQIHVLYFSNSPFGGPKEAMAHLEAFIQTYCQQS